MADLNMFKNVVPELYEEQIKCISFLYKNLEELHHFSENLFTDYTCNKIYKSLVSLYDDKLPINIESVYDNFNDLAVTKEQLQEIFDYEFIIENIPSVKEKLKKVNVQTKVLLSLEEIATEMFNKEFNILKVKDYANKILEDAFDIDKSKNILTAEMLMDIYEEKLQQREENSINRSLGYNCLNRLLTRPGAGGEMTIILGNKGSGKSLLLKCIENILINCKTCVGSINLEMTEESNCDRLMSLRTGLAVKEDILNKDIEERKKDKLYREIARFKQYQNYIYYNSSEMNLDQFDSFIYESKKILKSKGLLPKDEYMVVTCDLLDMIDEISSSRNPYELKNAVNKIHKMYKRHNIHLIGLVQSNENQMRGNNKRFKDPEDCEKHYLQLEDIEGGAIYGARARVVLALNRPLVLKRRFFPTRNEEFDLEDDVLTVAVVKQNDGLVGGLADFIFDVNSFKLHEYRREKKEVKQ